MKHVIAYKVEFILILMGIAVCNSPLEATYCTTGKAQIGIDGSNKIGAIWESSDPSLSISTIQASYGNVFPGEIIEITDPKFYHAQNPLIAFSSSPLATTKAAATWISKDLKTNNKVIQATILTTLGWNKEPVILSYNDGSEQVCKDHKISISSDGRTIIVNWTSFFPSLVNSIACCSISTNGGITWSKPAKLSKVKEPPLSEEQKLPPKQE